MEFLLVFHNVWVQRPSSGKPWVQFIYILLRFRHWNRFRFLKSEISSDFTSTHNLISLRSHNVIITCVALFIQLINNILWLCLEMRFIHSFHNRSAVYYLISVVLCTREGETLQRFLMLTAVCVNVKNIPDGWLVWVDVGGGMQRREWRTLIWRMSLILRGKSLSDVTEPLFTCWLLMRKHTPCSAGTEREF